MSYIISLPIKCYGTISQEDLIAFLNSQKRDYITLPYVYFSNPNLWDFADMGKAAARCLEWFILCDKLWVQIETLDTPDGKLLTKLLLSQDTLKLTPNLLCNCVNGKLVIEKLVGFYVSLNTEKE